MNDPHATSRSTSRRSGEATVRRSARGTARRTAKTTATPTGRSPRAVSERVIGRLAFYRRILQRAAEDGRVTIYSHEIAEACDATSTQVRRDLMAVGFPGHPIHGYDVEGLLAKMDRFLEVHRGVRLALVGVGNLGRALMSYFSRGRSTMTIEAAFDVDPARVNRTIGGIHSYPLDQLPDVLAGTKVDVGVIAVPEDAAQHVADLLVAAGVRSLINLAPVRVRVPRSVFVEDVDIGIAIERAAFYARRRPRKG